MARTTKTRTTSNIVTKRKPKPAAARPAAKKTETVELRPIVLEALKTAGVKVTVREAPKGNYASLLQGKTNVAYVDKQTAKGMKVHVVGTPAQVGNGFKASGRSGRFGATLVVTTQAEAVKAAKGIKAAANIAAGLPAQAKEAPAPRRSRKAKEAAAVAEVAELAAVVDAAVEAAPNWDGAHEGTSPQELAAVVAAGAEELKS